MRGHQHTNLPDFPKNCMKLRKFWSVGGWRRGATWIRHCIFMEFSVKILPNNRFSPPYWWVAPPLEKSWIRHCFQIKILAPLCPCRSIIRPQTFYNFLHIFLLIFRFDLAFFARLNLCAIIKLSFWFLKILSEILRKTFILNYKIYFT